MSPTSSDFPGVVKLIDFGLSRIIESQGTPRNYGVVTVWYRAPELLLGDTQYDEKVDIWAAGCIFGELLSGNILFSTKQKVSEKDPTAFNPSQIAQIIDILGPISDCDCARNYKFKNRLTEMPKQAPTSSLRQKAGCDDVAFGLLSRLLTLNPDCRISAGEALRHQYFNERPICVMNIAAQIPEDEWSDLTAMGGRTSDG
jgi:serine/threonine protein kinase